MIRGSASSTVAAEQQQQRQRGRGDTAIPTWRRVLVEARVLQLAPRSEIDFCQLQALGLLEAACVGGGGVGRRWGRAAALDGSK